MTVTILDAMYPIPVNGPFDERYFHEDLQRMSALELRREYERAHHRLLMEERPHYWLVDRIGCIREALNHVNR
ncbi:MAG: hypothetical protein OEU68_08225 [Nitrospira sp.]|nr:hypothetical protein [Nitrospira sp.]MDH4243532.1 hypothetical protein [Nitrospira sp.]MDH4355585.1 hypothetical protein [Nitrospira sp.]MDH5318077.1 hypothetical protein [Nitrospira sp.]